MKYDFDWQSFGGSLQTGIVLALIPVGFFLIYFLFHAFLFVLPVIIAVLIILGVLFVVGYAIREIFFKQIK